MELARGTPPPTPLGRYTSRLNRQSNRIDPRMQLSIDRSRDLAYPAHTRFSFQSASLHTTGMTGWRRWQEPEALPPEPKLSTGRRQTHSDAVGLVGPRPV